MSCLICCCCARPAQETDRQNSAELEMVRGDSDSASAVLDTEPRRERDSLSIAQSGRDTVTEMPIIWQILKNLNTNPSVVEDIAIPTDHQKFYIVDDIGDLNKSNIEAGAEHLNNQAVVSKGRDEFRDGILQKINLRRSEMSKSDVIACDELSAIARKVNLHVNRIRSSELRGHLYGCLVFKIDWKKLVALSDLPQVVVNQWCPKSEEISSSTTAGIEASCCLIQNHRHNLIKQTKMYGNSKNSAISLMMNEQYKRVGIDVCVLSKDLDEAKSPDSIAGVVLFDDFQIGFYTELSIGRKYLTTNGSTAHNHLQQWSRAVAKALLSEFAVSLKKHAMKSEFRTGRMASSSGISVPLLAESERRRKEAELLKTCVNASAFPPRADAELKRKIAYFEALLRRINQLGFRAQEDKVDLDAIFDDLMGMSYDLELEIRG